MINRRKSFSLLTLFILATLVGCSEQTSAPTEVVLPPATVQIETLSLSTVPFQTEVAGTVQAVDQAEIAPRISGPVLKVTVHAGSKVKKGDLLVKIGAAEITAQLRRAETQRAQAMRNFERESKLLKANASTETTVKSLGEMLKIAEASYTEARAMLDYATIRAPFSGTVTKKMVEVGDLALPGKVLLTLESGIALELLTHIPETLVQNLALGDLLQVTIPAAGLSVAAPITEIAPTVDTDSRTTQVKLTLPDNPTLRSGQFARINLPDTNSSTLIIAKSALHYSGQMAQVFVADQEVARLRLVRVGASYGDRIEILSGLQAGDQIVVSVEKPLRDGQPLIFAGDLSR